MESGRQQPANLSPGHLFCKSMKLDIELSLLQFIYGLPLFRCYKSSVKVHKIKLSFPCNNLSDEAHGRQHYYLFSLSNIFLFSGSSSLEPGRAGHPPAGGEHPPPTPATTPPTPTLATPPTSPSPLISLTPTPTSGRHWKTKQFLLFSV